MTAVAISRHAAVALPRSALIEKIIIALLLMALTQVRMSTWDLILPISLPKFVEQNLHMLPQPMAPLRWLRTVVLFAVFAYSTALLLPKFRACIRLSLHNLMLCGFVLFVAASCLWSLEPYYSLRGAFVMITALMVATYMHLRLRPTDMLHVLFYVFAVLLFLNYAFFLAGASQARNFGYEEFTGLFGNKNAVGFILGLSAITFICTYANQCVARPISLFCLLLSVFALYLSQTYTSILSFIIACGMAAMATSFVKRRLYLFTFLLMLALAVAIFMAGLASDFFETIGKDPSRRTDLWESAVESALSRPILGHGYLAFWANDEVAEGFRNLADQGYYTFHGHNGYVDAFLYFGVVGLGLFVLMLASSMLRSMWQLSRFGAAYGSWRLMVILFFSFTAITESCFNISLLMWVLAFYAMLQQPHALAFRHTA